MKVSFCFKLPQTDAAFNSMADHGRTDTADSINQYEETKRRSRLLPNGGPRMDYDYMLHSNTFTAHDMATKSNPIETPCADGCKRKTNQANGWTKPDGKVVCTACHYRRERKP